MRSAAGKTEWSSHRKNRRNGQGPLPVFSLLWQSAEQFSYRNFGWYLCSFCVLTFRFFWILKKRKTDCDENCLLACIVVLMAVMTLVGTFVGVKLMGLTTLPTVEKKIAAEGFTDVEYNTWMSNRWLDLDENNEKKYYVFKRKRMGRAGRLPPTPRAVSLCRLQRRRIDAPCRNRKLCVK